MGRHKDLRSIAAIMLDAGSDVTHDVLDSNGKPVDTFTLPRMRSCIECAEFERVRHNKIAGTTSVDTVTVRPTDLGGRHMSAATILVANRPEYSTPTTPYRVTGTVHELWNGRDWMIFTGLDGAPPSEAGWRKVTANW